MIREIRLAVTLAAVLIIAAEQVHAAVVIDLSGTTGSSTINIEMNGTLIESLGTQYGVFGINFPTEDFDFLATTQITGDTRVENLTTNAIVPIDSILLGASTEFQLGTSSPIIAQPGEILQFSGMGTFQLPAGRTFDEFDTGTFIGDFTHSGASGNGVTLNVGNSPSAVPEPTSLALFGISACVAGVGAARRRQREQDQEATT